MSAQGDQGSDSHGKEESLLELARSSRWADRVRAARGLAGVGTEPAVEGLRVLLVDPDDTAVAEAAASALLRRGDPEWDAVLEAVWRAEEVGRSEALRAAFIELQIAGIDVESRLEARAGAADSTAARKGALETLMGLGLRPVEYIPDDDEEEETP